MSGLYGSLSTALSALIANQQGLEITANNVANVNTPGFSRQRPVMEPASQAMFGSVSIGTGVEVARIESLRDPILEIRLHQETQEQGKLNSMLTALDQVQTMFSGGDAGIGAAITKFFSSLQNLSTDPANLSQRQSVLTAAGNMAQAFNTTANNLQTQRGNLDLNIVQTVNQINSITTQLSSVAGNIAELVNSKQDASALLDNQTSLIRQLSSLIDVSVIQTEYGMALTTSNGTPLLAGSKNFQLTTQIGADGVQHVLAGGRDITSTLTAGSLAGFIEMRDQEIPGILGRLDQLAAGLGNALNAAHRGGFDLNGDPGADLFLPSPVGNLNAASSMGLAITDPDLVAASSDGTSGSNGNLTALSAVHDQAIVNGQKPLDIYSQIVFTVGRDTSNTSAELDASNLILQQLSDQRASVSAVSLDEEAANMVRYQTAYQAAARVVTTINEMLQAAVNFGRY
jgi:flagellar hook-associated protein 1 FlgK